MKKLLPLILFSLICGQAWALTAEEAKVSYQGLECQITAFNEMGNPICAQCNDLTEILVHYDPQWDISPLPEPIPSPEPIPQPLTFLEVDISLSTPNNGQMWNNTSGPSASIQISNFVPGEYTFLVYGNGPDGSSDSVHYGINGIIIGAITLRGYESPNPHWSSDLQAGGTAKITIPDSGAHIISLWAREDGCSVTKIRIGELPSP